MQISPQRFIFLQLKPNTGKKKSFLSNVEGLFDLKVLGYGHNFMIFKSFRF